MRVINIGGGAERLQSASKIAQSKNVSVTTVWRTFDVYSTRETV